MFLFYSLKTEVNWLQANCPVIFLKGVHSVSRSEQSGVKAQDVFGRRWPAQAARRGML